MRAKEFLNEGQIKIPVTFTYTGKDGRFMGDYVYITIDQRDLSDILMYCMESDGSQYTSGIIAEIASKYFSRYQSAVRKRKKELGIS